ncbi:UvrD-like helicase family protein [Pontibacter ummariensis]|uniref:UvrD-like helicase C-terminal domain-containing protein n=1 Tax=Pontibacter ummariensis TaxID=1610492 RepID=A0A239C4Z8_9BACT|nr:AAA family ATPase [Pontibacter ummariensis]PRY15445.1 UvrD-like helicase family protein [Pontibacter ummariensis]SNS15180.1 UvrD-like helicase C-terminal domain-containing protein [Pontibacter ummariensis]
MRPVEALRNSFPFEPTEDQARLFAKLDEFIVSKQEERQVFLLKGYAGTGKTTVVTSLVKILNSFGYKYVLLAPTGRAAKVMASYSGHPAFTIHKKIYRQTANPFSEGLSFTRQPNKSDHTVYIVDEASMISDESGFGENGLLQDLMSFVFDKKHNKLLLIGDTAQLPPVGQVVSPSLDANYLKQNFRCQVQEIELRQVMRQAEASGILMNATQLRDQMRQERLEIKLFTKGWRDIYKMTGEKLEDGLRYAYDKFGIENTIVICRSNKSANLYNQHIRRSIFFAEDEIGVGDYLMVVRNNYFWLPKDSDIGFMANGDFVEITKIVRYEEMYGFRFADVRLRFVDYPDAPEEEMKIMLDTLYSDAPALPADQNKKLYEEVLQDYLDIKTKRDRNKELKKNPYLNALQVKFAYALTCHKAQGGQWQAVFVDQGFLKEDMVNEEFARWLYTALTRSSEELYLLNFNQQILVS